MAGIAEVLLNLGYPVSGSDMRSTALTGHLASLGAVLSFEHRAENVVPGTSVVVYSSAVKSDNPEIVAARSLGIPVIARAEMLAELMRMKYGIAVAGSHGKTTTTSMTAHLLRLGDLDPTVIIGGRVLSDLSGASLGRGDYLVAEADESDGSFRFLKPAIAVVTNIDAEHMSFYESFGKLESAFFEFLSSLPFYGLAVLCKDNPVVMKMALRLERRICTYGLSPEADICARDICQEGNGTYFNALVDGEDIGRFHLPLPGSHMVCNSLASLAVARELGIEPKEAAGYLGSFSGVVRRSQVLFENAGVVLIDDYGHHPTEIVATLRSIRAGWISAQGSKGKRLRVVFEPHRYTRTRDHFAQFVKAFDDADEVTITNIYPAGELPIENVSGEQLSLALDHPSSCFTTNPAQALEAIFSDARCGDVIVTLGAGSIGQAAQACAKDLRNHKYENAIGHGD